jgi:hypothetical protein
MASSQWYKSMKRIWHSTYMGANDVTYGIRHGIDPTYRKPSQAMRSNDNTPVLFKDKQEKKDNAKLVEELALSMAQLGVTIGTKSQRAGKAFGIGVGGYRRYRYASRGTGVYSQTSRNSSYRNTMYADRPGNGTYQYRRNKSRR